MPLILSRTLGKLLTPSESPFPLLKIEMGASLVAQWLRIHLPMQETQVRALVQEAPTCAEQLSPRATTAEPAL